MSTRLYKRAQDSEAIIKQRLSEARTEISHYTEYDYLVVNQDFETALDDLKAIIRADRLKRERHSLKEAQLLSELLKSE